MHPESVPQFQIRQANHADVRELRILIERSVRQLQRNDYTPAQIEGALGHALGLDTQLIEDGTYFAAIPVSNPNLIARVWRMELSQDSFRQRSWAA